MITRKSLQNEIRTIQSIIGKLDDYVDHHNDLHFDLDTSISVIFRKIEDLETKVQFLDDNRDAIEMWIECVRQTQQLYKESQKPVDTYDE